MSRRKNIAIPTATRLPSGKWRVQLRLTDPVTHQLISQSITRPTEKEAVAEALAIKAGILKSRPEGENMLVREAIAAYISAREYSKSPQTIAGYYVIARNRFRGIQNLRLRDLTQARWQAAVDKEKLLVSAKTVKSSASLVQSAIFEQTGVRLRSSLAQVVPKEIPWLEPEQIPVFLEAVRGNKYEIPLLLALSGLRRSEIAAVRWKDIDLIRGTVTVEGTAVLDKDGNLIDREENKNLSSRRVVRFMIPQLRQAVAAQPRDPDAYVYHHSSNVLTENSKRICTRAGLPPVTTHGLRHTFASLCAHLRIPEPVTMEMGGWSDPTVVRKIYTHVAHRDVLTESAHLEEFFNNAHESAHAKEKTIVLQQF